MALPGECGVLGHRAVPSLCPVPCGQHRHKAAALRAPSPSVEESRGIQVGNWVLGVVEHSESIALACPGSENTQLGLPCCPELWG